MNRETSMNPNPTGRPSTEVGPRPVLTVTDGRAGDLDDVLMLLAASGLGTDGVPEHITDFLVAREGGRLVATAALEDYGDAGLLRSVAVVANRRGWGLGRYLTHTLIERARQRGHAAVYLLTDTAEAYFTRLGFRSIDRSAVRPAVVASAQFQGETCSQSVVMVLEFADHQTIRGSQA
jgi:amino-acid N-acetyltransferase